MIDQRTINRIRRLLAQRHGLNLPPDCNPKSFARDLLCALHGHPGYPQDPSLIDDDFDEEDDAGDMGEYEDEGDDDEEDAGSGQLSHARRDAIRDEVLRNVGGLLAERGRTRLSQASSRGDRVLAEVLANCGLA